MHVRSDGARNRDRIVGSARELFATRGTDVTMRAVARHAGVAAATLYRHFPTREDLVRAAFAEEISICSVRTDEALADPDPWRGLQTVIREVALLQAKSSGFAAALFDEFPDGADVPDGLDAGDERVRALHNLRELIVRAQESGDLRPDFAPSDLILLMRASNTLMAVSPESSQRLVAYLLQAFTARASSLPAATPVSVLGVEFP